MRLVVDIHKASASFPVLVKQVEAGDKVIATRVGKPVAKLVGYAPSRRAGDLDHTPDGSRSRPASTNCRRDSRRSPSPRPARRAGCRPRR
jgi:prevent-host-death family protein